MKIAAIPRASADSPNMSDKDMALFHLVAGKLSEEGHCVEIIGADNEIPSGCEIIFHMTRTAETLKQIATREREGTIAVNSSTGTRNCSRLTFTRILAEEGIEQPPYTILGTNAPAPEGIFCPGWLKKAEGWSSLPDDVQYIATEDELAKGLASLRERGIGEAIYCKHITGDLIKFYGIASHGMQGGFFRFHYPTDGKFGKEKINGTPHRYPFDEKELHATAFKAAAAIGVEVFGGDCIVSHDGRISIIDMNDTPSFSAYREEAALHIVQLITEKRK